MRSSWAAVAAITAVFLAGCGKKTSGPAAQSDKTVQAQPVEYGPAAGQRLEYLLTNPTETKEYLGFRIHYTLTEPEYEPVTPARVWQDTPASSWVDRDTFFNLPVQFVRLVRPTGSAGWQTGYFLAEYYKQTPPEVLFRSNGGVIHLEPANGKSSFQVVGKFVENFPDDGRKIGRRLSTLSMDEHFSTSDEIVDVAAPDFEPKLKAIIAAKQAELDVAKLPWIVRQVSAEKRAEGLARATELGARTQQMVAGKREWQGVVAFPKQAIPIVLTMDYVAPNPKEPWATSLHGTITWKGSPQLFPPSFNGGINSNEKSEFWLSSYWLNTGNLTPESVEATRQRMETNPLTNSDRDLNNMVLRIVDRDQIEIRADGIPPTVLTRTGASGARPSAPEKNSPAPATQSAVAPVASTESAPVPPAGKLDPAAALESFRQKLYPLRARGDKGTTWRGTAAYPATNIQVQVKITFPPFLDPKKFLESSVFCEFKILQAKPYSKFLSGKVDARNDAPFPNESFLFNAGNPSEAQKTETANRMATAPLQKLEQDLRNLVVRIIDENTMEIRADGVPTTTLSLVN